ncbi:ABC transporter substrate-binding protein [Paenibacillus oceani]|uniref:Extracellular solute-binding protein n=1 Tax=Paenibacillus oceani TaxID=2772510 RepID=A0A927CG17_9BACL|nr:extracellular solute-binding protein [Paenibacillus oceani]MBD2865105.1 extracellular solute-binding protein [Paenibacillus oceani]
MKKVLFFAVAIGALSVASGCGDNAGETELPAKGIVQETKKPVTLTIYPMVTIADEDFQKLFVDPVKKKHPHITLELIKRGKGNTLTELIMAGSPPDMNLITQGGIPSLRSMDLLEDLTGHLKKHQVDLTRFDQAYIDAIKVTSDKGEIYALPYTVNFNALYYNKTIFNKFGVDFPKDGMLWEDVIELAKKLTRTDAGVSYKGLDPEKIERLARPLSALTVDPATNKSLLQSDKWRKTFELARAIYTIPGNEFKKGSLRSPFWTEQNIAMLATINIIPFLKEPTEQGLDWDLAQYPSYKELPNVYGQVDGNYVMPLKTSKHMDDVIKVMDAVTSEEAQLIGARQLGRQSPLKNPAIKKAIGQDMPHVKGKRIESIFKSVPAPYLPPALYDGKSSTVINEALDLLLGGKDLNTVLHEAEEKHNKFLDEEKK